MSAQLVILSEVRAASRSIDWDQVISNGGPPCFHVEDGRFCLRAERWDGHQIPGFHSFRALNMMLEDAIKAAHETS